MITELEVLSSYSRKLQLQVRQMKIERSGRMETPQEAEERIDAIADHDNLELRYQAQFTY